MRPETLNFFLTSLRPGEIHTVNDLLKKSSGRDRERLRKWLEELDLAGLVERVEIDRAQDGKRNCNHARVGYRMKYRPIN